MAGNKKEGVQGLRELQRKRLEAGLCMRCGLNPPRPGLKICMDCTVKMREYAVRLRDKYREEHRCQSCGRYMPEDWYYSTCEDCKKVSYDAYYRRAERRRAAGQCPKCGKPMDRKGGMCTACLNRERSYFIKIGRQGDGQDS